MGSFSSLQLPLSKYHIGTCGTKSQKGKSFSQALLSLVFMNMLTLKIKMQHTQKQLGHLVETPQHPPQKLCRQLETRTHPV